MLPRLRRGALQLPELLDRDVAAHEVLGLDLCERRLLLDADRAEKRGQRVWKTQPDGGSAADGISPSRSMRVRCSPSMVGTADSSASV